MRDYNFIYNVPTKVYFGQDQLSYLGAELRQYGERILLLYGGGSIKKTGLYDQVVQMIREAGLQLFEQSGIEPNPRHTSVDQAAALCRRERIDAILAVGGGSVLDAGKMTSVAAFYEGSCWDIISKKVPVTNALPLITILTLAATGSEMDDGCIITNLKLNAKNSIHHDLLRPKASFLDPANTYTVSPYQTACGSADILSHILETAIFCSPGLYMVDCVAEALLKVVIKYAPIAMERPADYEARANLMWASSWALNGILQDGRKCVSPNHAMEHELSAYYDITHGLGLAILMPRWMEYILDEKTAPTIAGVGVSAFGVHEHLPLMEAAQRTVQALSDFFFETLKLPKSLSKFGVDGSHFEDMAQAACQKYQTFNDPFRPLSQRDLVEIYKMCL